MNWLGLYPYSECKLRFVLKLRKGLEWKAHSYGDRSADLEQKARPATAGYAPKNKLTKCFVLWKPLHKATTYGLAIVLFGAGFVFAAFFILAQPLRTDEPAATKVVVEQDHLRLSVGWNAEYTLEVDSVNKTKTLVLRVAR